MKEDGRKEETGSRGGDRVRELAAEVRAAEVCGLVKGSDIADFFRRGMELGEEITEIGKGLQRLANKMGEIYGGGAGGL